MKNHAVNDEYVQNLVEGLLNEEVAPKKKPAKEEFNTDDYPGHFPDKVQEEGVVKDLVGAATGPTAKKIYRRGAEALGSAGEVVGDFVSGGVEKAAPGFKKKAGRVWKATKNKVGDLVGKGVNAANDWSKTPDKPQGDTSEGTEPKSLPAPKK